MNQPLKIHGFEFNPFGEITYIIWDPASKEGAVVDPGMSDDYERSRFKEFIHRQDIELKYLLYTHLHIDHTFGHEFIKEEFGLRAMAHPSDASLGARRDAQAQMFRLQGFNGNQLTVEIPLHDNQELLLGTGIIKVIHVPGHSQGSVAYYAPDAGFVITGDALFAGSIGRTDLPGGNYTQLIGSINSRLMNLPPDTVVYPGHGPATTIGKERAKNYMLRV